MDTLTGYTLKQYQLLYRLKTEHENYLGFDINSNPKLIKCFGSDDDSNERYKREVHALNKLKHDRIPKLEDVGTKEEHGKFIVIDYKKGKALDKILDKIGQINELKAIKIVSSLCDVVDHIHNNQIVHQDIKPSNILLTKGYVPSLLDFGYAHDKELGDANDDFIRGTVDYMSPIQLEGKVEFESDIYSLGITLYELVTGKLPFQGKTIAEVSHAHFRGEYLLPHLVNSKVSKNMSKIIAQTLTKRSHIRFKTAKELKNALEESLIKSK